MHSSKTGSWFVSGKATHLSRTATTGLLATMLLLPLGCKTGESWAPKMPKFGMPEIAFGKKSAEDEIQPPAMRFSPDGDMGSPDTLPERSLAGSSYTPNQLPREPYAVDEAPEDLGDLAARRSEEILQRELENSRRRIQPQVNAQVNALAEEARATREQLNQGLDRIPGRQYLAPSGDPTINRIPGGSLNNEFESPRRDGTGLAGSVPPALPSPPSSTGFPEMNRVDSGNARIAPNSSSAGTALVGNQQNIEPSRPALPTPPVANDSLSQLAPPSNPFTSPSNPLGSLPNPGAGLPTTSGSSTGLPTPGAGLPPLAQTTLPPINRNPTLPGLPAATTAQDPTRMAAAPSATATPVQYAVPNSSGGFVPGEIATTGGLETLPTLGTRSQYPLGGGMTKQPSTQPGTNAPGVIQNQFDNSNRNYPSTGSPGFQPSFGAPAGSPAPSGIPAPAAGTFNSAAPSQPVGHTLPGAPAGMVCDGDQCYIPNTAH